jgi:hypothetical protein
MEQSGYDLIYSIMLTSALKDCVKPQNLSQDSQRWSQDSKLIVRTFDYWQTYSGWANLSTEQKKEVGYKKS